MPKQTAHTYQGLTIPEANAIVKAAHALRYAHARLTFTDWTRFDGDRKTVALGRVLAAMDIAEDTLFAILNFSCTYLDDEHARDAIGAWRDDS
jgi:hypothetical protein